MNSFVVLCVVLAAAVCAAAPLNVLQTLSSGQRDVPVALAMYGRDYVLMAGRTNGSLLQAGYNSPIFRGDTNNDGWVVKAALNGSSAGGWARQIGNHSVDSLANDGVAAVASSASAVYACGFTDMGVEGIVGDGSRQAFIVKLDAQTGVTSAALVFGAGSNSTLVGADYCEGLTVDISTGSVFAVGTVDGNLHLESNEMVSLGKTDAFLVRFDDDLVPVWAHQIGDAEDDRAVAVAMYGAPLDVVYMCGCTQSTIPGGGLTYSRAPRLHGAVWDGFLAQYAINNGDAGWVRQFGTPHSDVVTTCIADETGVYVAGYTHGSFPGQHANLGGGSTTDAFVLKYSHSSVLLWSSQIGGNTPAAAESVWALYTRGHVLFAAGSTDSSVDSVGDDGAAHTHNQMMVLSFLKESGARMVSGTRVLSSGCAEVCKGITTRENELLLLAETQCVERWSVGAEAANTSAEVPHFGGIVLLSMQHSFANTSRPKVTMSTATSNVTAQIPISVTIRFDKPVLGLAAEDVAAGGADVILVPDRTTLTQEYVATIHQNSADILHIRVPANAVADEAMNLNEASDEMVIHYDASPIGVSIVAPQYTNSVPIPVTFRFNKTVSGLSVAEIIVTNGSIGNSLYPSSANALTDQYTASLVPTRGGSITVSLVPAAVTDLVPNDSPEAFATIIYDIVPPTVSISAPATSVQLEGPHVIFTLVFSEPVVGLSNTKLSVMGGTVKSINPPPSANASAQYNVSVEPSELEGSVTLVVPKGVVEDRANNVNSNGALRTIAFDFSPPSGEIKVAEVVPNVPFEVDIQFDQLVTGLQLGALTIENGVVATTLTPEADTPTKSYRCSVLPSSGGENAGVRITVAAQAVADASGNGNAEAFTALVTVDALAPMVTIRAATHTVHTRERPVQMILVFSEAVLGVSEDIVTVQGGVLLSGPTQAEAGSNVYSITVDVNMTSAAALAGWPVTVSIAPDSFTNARNVSNTQLASYSIVFDNIEPRAALRLVGEELQIHWSETVSINNLNASALSFTSVTPSVPTAVPTVLVLSPPSQVVTHLHRILLTSLPAAGMNVTIPANVVQDEAGNWNKEISAFVAVDTRGPQLTLSSADVRDRAFTNLRSFTLDIVSSQPLLTAIDLGQFTVARASLSELAMVETDVHWTVQVTPEFEGEIVVSITEGTLADDDSVQSDMVTFTVNYDASAPNATITSPADTVGESEFPITIEWNEAVLGFAESDIFVTNGAVKAGSLRYTDPQRHLFTARVVASRYGVARVSVAAGSVTDKAGNANTLSDLLEVAFIVPVEAPKLKTDTLSYTGFTLTWPTNEATNDTTPAVYTLYYSPYPTMRNEVAHTLKDGSNERVFKGLVPNTAYYVRLVADFGADLIRRSEVAGPFSTADPFANGAPSRLFNLLKAKAKEDGSCLLVEQRFNPLSTLNATEVSLFYCASNNNEWSTNTTCADGSAAALTRSGVCSRMHLLQEYSAYEDSNLDWQSAWLSAVSADTSTSMDRFKITSVSAAVPQGIYVDFCVLPTLSPVGCDTLAPMDEEKGNATAVLFQHKLSFVDADNILHLQFLSSLHYTDLQFEFASQTANESCYTPQVWQVIDSADTLCAVRYEFTMPAHEAFGACGFRNVDSFEDFRVFTTIVRATLKQPALWGATSAEDKVLSLKFPVQVQMPELVPLRPSFHITSAASVQPAPVDVTIVEARLNAHTKEGVLRVVTSIAFPFDLKTPAVHVANGSQILADEMHVQRGANGESKNCSTKGDKCVQHWSIPLTLAPSVVCVAKGALRLVLQWNCLDSVWDACKVTRPKPLEISLEVPTAQLCGVVSLSPHIVLSSDVINENSKGMTLFLPLNQPVHASITTRVVSDVTVQPMQIETINMSSGNLTVALWKNGAPTRAGVLAGLKNMNISALHAGFDMVLLPEHVQFSMSNKTAAQAVLDFVVLVPYTPLDVEEDEPVPSVRMQLQHKLLISRKLASTQSTRSKAAAAMDALLMFGVSMLSLALVLWIVKKCKSYGRIRIPASSSKTGISSALDASAYDRHKNRDFGLETSDGEALQHEKYVYGRDEGGAHEDDDMDRLMDMAYGRDTQTNGGSGRRGDYSRVMEMEMGTLGTADFDDDEADTVHA